MLQLQSLVRLIHILVVVRCFSNLNWFYIIAVFGSLNHHWRSRTSYGKWLLIARDKWLSLINDGSWLILRYQLCYDLRLNVVTFLPYVPINGVSFLIFTGVGHFIRNSLVWFWRKSHVVIVIVIWMLRQGRSLVAYLSVFTFICHLYQHRS